MQVYKTTIKDFRIECSHSLIYRRTKRSFPYLENRISAHQCAALSVQGDTCKLRLPHATTSYERAIYVPKAGGRIAIPIQP